MAVDVYSDISSPVVSPRISFSHDLREADDTVPIECRHHRSDAFLLEPTIDFDFCNGQILSQTFSSADELFANGKILPVEVKKTPQPIQQIHQIDPVSRFSSSTNGKKTENAANEETNRKTLKEFLYSLDAEDCDKKPSGKPFWQFRRSSSLNYEKSGSNGLIRSLQFLSRSNSTGSAPNPKQCVTSVTSRVQNFRSTSETKDSSVGSAPQFYSYNSSKGRSLKKSYSSGIRINPVLNIPSSYLSKGTINLFGFCSLFSNSKSKKKKIIK